MNFVDTSKSTLVIGFILMTLLFTGCQSFQDRIPKVDTQKLAFWKAKEITDGSNAQKVVALWSDNVAYGAEFGAKRGLGGRLYFYDDQQKPTKVEGELVVYVYDDDKNPEATKPDKKFVFTAEEFSQFYSESEFGPSYSVWVPWDDVGNAKRAVSLVPILKSTSGKLLVGEHSRSLLPGKTDRLRKKTTTSEISRRRADATSIRRASFVDASSKDLPRRNVKRSSIRMPDTMKQRIIEQAKASGNDVEFQPIEAAATFRKDPYQQSTATENDVADSATDRPQYLGLRRPIRLRSE